MIWSFGRAVVWLKRSALALERIADSQRDLAFVARADYSLRHPATRPIRKAEFGVADIDEDWNKRYAIETGQEEG
jgi:hypothetical protein